MEPLQGYLLEQSVLKSDDRCMSRLIDPSGNAKIDVSGCILEAIYQVKGEFLLLTTDNSPYRGNLAPLFV